MRITLLIPKYLESSFRYILFVYRITYYGIGMIVYGATGKFSLDEILKKKVP
jgi:hypothetical protein